MNNEKPLKVKVNSFNKKEMLEFKERRRFESYKQQAHYYFDKIWRDAEILTREEAYNWLSKKLQINESDAHFSKINNEKCKEAIWFCQQLLNDNRRMDLDFGQNPITPFYILD